MGDLLKWKKSCISINAGCVHKCVKEAELCTLSLLHCCSPASDFSALVLGTITSILPLISLGLSVIWKLKLQFSDLSVSFCQEGWSYLHLLFISLFPFASNQICIYCLLPPSLSGTSRNLLCLETSPFIYLFLLAQDEKDEKGAVPGFGALLPEPAQRDRSISWDCRHQVLLWTFLPFERGLISGSTDSVAIQAEHIPFYRQKELWGPESDYWSSF